MAKILSIKKIKNEYYTGTWNKPRHADVYDIEVQDNHNYIANNLLVSNSGSVSYTNLLSEVSHIYYRFGFTGTFIRNDSKTLDMWGFLATKLYSYPAYKAIEDGFLTPMEVHIHEIKGQRKAQYKTEYNKNYCENPLLLDKIASIINSIDNTKQILILVNRKDKSGKIIHEYLNALHINNTYISGDDSAKVINNTIDDFNEKRVNVLIGSSVIGEGINICSSDHLIMAQGGKSEIVIVQALGRLARLFPGKEIGIVHDFSFIGTKYMNKHLQMRKDVYNNNIAPRVIKEV